jgi:glycosyltransferase involved in cell wall biosynthesis
MCLESLTVLTTNFNKLSYVPLFIQHALEILQSGAKIVLIDDGSTDGSFELLKLELGFMSGVEIIRTPNNGSASARNLALSEVETSFFMYLDIDDKLNIPVVSKTMIEMQNSEADIAVANYRTFPLITLGGMPQLVSKPTKFQMSKIRDEYFQSLGYWRAIYRTARISRTKIRFLPTFSEVGGNVFILDDLYWLVQVSSLNIDVLIMPPTEIIYEYYRPEDSSESWNRYLRQLTFMIQANQILLKETSRNPEIDFHWLRRASNDFLYKHLRFLDFSFGFRILKDFRKFLMSNTPKKRIKTKIYYQYLVFRLGGTFLLTSSGLRPRLRAVRLYVTNRFK